MFYFEMGCFVIVDIKVFEIYCMDNKGLIMVVDFIFIGDLFMYCV